jgi:hypothetical protein
VRSSVDLPLDATARGSFLSGSDSSTPIPGKLSAARDTLISKTAAILLELDKFLSGFCVGATFGICFGILGFVLIR